jgi:hypothetical protein
MQFHEPNNYSLLIISYKFQNILLITNDTLLKQYQLYEKMHYLKTKLKLFKFYRIYTICSDIYLSKNVFFHFINGNDQYPLARALQKFQMKVLPACWVIKYLLI